MGVSARTHARGREIALNAPARAHHVPMPARARSEVDTIKDLLMRCVSLASVATAQESASLELQVCAGLPRHVQRLL